MKFVSTLKKFYRWFIFFKTMEFFFQNLVISYINAYYFSLIYLKTSYKKKTFNMILLILYLICNLLYVEYSVIRMQYLMNTCVAPCSLQTSWTSKLQATLKHSVLYSFTFSLLLFKREINRTFFKEIVTKLKQDTKGPHRLPEQQKIQLDKKKALDWL